MNTLLVLNKENFEILLEKNFRKSQTTLNPNSQINREASQNYYSNVIGLVQDLDAIDMNEESYMIKLDGGKTVVYRKSMSSIISIILITDKKLFPKNDLIDISKVYLNGVESVFLKYQSNLEKFKTLNFNHFNFKEMTTKAIDDLTINFIENLRLNKLYAKFIYFNYNQNVVNSISYKKSKLESTSVILYNSHKDYDKIVEPKDTILHRSTIKEKELNIELEKKANPPSEKKIFIKKFNNAKSESIKKKNISKYFSQNFFIEKYFLTKNSMIHYLFNNIFLENVSQKSQVKDGYVFPINSENEYLLLFAIDIYDKAQSLFSVSKPNSQEFLDIVNYIEINLSKPDVMLMKSKLILIRYKSLFVLINLEIYEDKNVWSSINNNTNFYKEIEILFSLVQNEVYQTFLE